MEDGEALSADLDAGSKLTSVRNDLQTGAVSASRTDGRWWASHTLANLRRVHTQLRKCAAERVAMHAELFRGLALITAMTREDFEDKALLELAHGVVVRKPRGMHLKDEVVEIAFHSRGSL